TPAGPDRASREVIASGAVDDAAVHVVPTPIGLVVGHRVGQVGGERVDHLVVAGRQHHVQAAVLAVQVPAPIVHGVGDAADVERAVPVAGVGLGVGVDAELEQRQVRVRGDAHPVDAGDAGGEAPHGGANPFCQAEV